MFSLLEKENYLLECAESNNCFATRSTKVKVVFITNIQNLKICETHRAFTLGETLH